MGRRCWGSIIRYMRFTKQKLQEAIVQGVLFSEGLLYHVEKELSLSKNIFRPGSEAYFNLIREARHWYEEGLLEIDAVDLDLIKSDLGEWGVYEGRQVALDYPISQEVDDIMMVADKGYQVSEKILNKIFTNEMGNEIEIEVRDSKHEDFLDNEEPYEGVFIRLTGPNSESSNVVTKREAQTLFSLLSDYFFNEELYDLYEGKRRKKKSKSGSYYQGKKVKLNKPTRNPGKSGGQYRVYVKDPKTGNVKKVTFGSREMKLRLSNPAARKSFAARHRCKETKDKTSARYWACRAGRYPSLTGSKSRYTWW